VKIIPEFDDPFQHLFPYVVGVIFLDQGFQRFGPFGK
jgi:hypothetical protein